MERFEIFAAGMEIGNALYGVEERSSGVAAPQVSRSRGRYVQQATKKLTRWTRTILRAMSYRNASHGGRGHRY